MKSEYNFPGGDRGTFYQADAEPDIPIYLDPDVPAFLQKVAVKKGTIMMPTALIYSLFRTLIPKYRVPTDGLIVLMVFLGTDLCRRSVRCAKMVFKKR